MLVIVDKYSFLKQKGIYIYFEDYILRKLLIIVNSWKFIAQKFNCGIL